MPPKGFTGGGDPGVQRLSGAVRRTQRPGEERAQYIGPSWAITSAQSTLDTSRQTASPRT
eukprot:1750318-Pyramimonas_sp.AAC.1